MAADDRACRRRPYPATTCGPSKRYSRLSALPRRVIGFVFQDFHFPTPSAIENVEVPTRFLDGDLRERARDLLIRVGLGDRLDHRHRPDVLGEFTRIEEAEDVAVIAVTHDELVTEHTDRVVNLADCVVVDDPAAVREDAAASGGGAE